METYSPYIVIEDTPSTLHLKEPQWRLYAMFFVFKILPLIFVGVIIAFILTAKDVPVSSLILTAIAVALPVIFLLSRSILIEVEITAIAVKIKTTNVFASKQRIIAVADVDRIICRRKRGKIQRLYIFSCYKNGQQKISLFKIWKVLYGLNKNAISN